MTRSARLAGVAVLALLAGPGPVRAGTEPPAPSPTPGAQGEELCAPRGVTIPLTAIQPGNWGRWISVTGLKDRTCRNVAPTELRIRAKKNSQGELEITFKITTWTRPGHDKRVAVILEVMSSDRAVKTTTIESIDAEENKSGRGTGYMFLPVDLVPGESVAGLRVSLDVVDR